MDKQFIDEQIEKAILYNMTHENCLAEIVKDTVRATCDKLIEKERAVDGRGMTNSISNAVNSYYINELKKQCE